MGDSSESHPAFSVNCSTPRQMTNKVDRVGGWGVVKGKSGETASNDRNETIPPPRDAMLEDGLVSPSSKALAPCVGTNEYAELKRIIKQQGLLDRQPAYYTYKILLTVGMLALSLTFLLVIDNLWLQLLNAAYLAFVFTQIGFIREEACRKQGIARFIVKHQAYLFFPITCLLAFSQHISGIQFLLQKQGKHTAAEALCMAIHFVLYFGLLVYFLPLWQAVLFVLIHQGLHGLYLASVFAPNHKGMPVLDKDSRLSFLRRQVLTARNVKAHPFTDFWYGGLNYQIEHHLFPKIPRNKLGEAQTIVKAFCQARSIPYYETGLLQSYRELLQHLHQVSAPLREEIH